MSKMRSFDKQMLEGEDTVTPEWSALILNVWSIETVILWSTWI